MATSATSGNVTLFKKGTVTIAEVRSVGGPSIARDVIDVSNMDSASYKEFVMGLIDAGEVTLDVNFLPANTTHTAITSDLTATATTAYALVWPDASSTTWTMNGYISGFTPTASVDDRLSAAVTFKISGAITYT